MPRRKRKQETRAAARDGFSNPMARLGAGTPSLIESTMYPMQRLTKNYSLLTSLYREHWIIRRIIDVIPADMVKNWITLTTGVEPRLLRKVDITLRKTQLIHKIREGMQWARLYGGAIGVLLVKGQGDSLKEPLNLSEILPGDFCGMMVMDRWNNLIPSTEYVTDITSPEYGLPKYYRITDAVTGESVSIHHSRCVRFIGNDLPYWESQTEDGWGASVIESVFDELKKRDNVSWNIAQLTFMASLRVLKMNDLGQLLSSTDKASQEEVYSTIQAQNWLMSNMGLQVIDAADGIESHQYTFGGMADVYKQFMEDIAGAAQIPATKLFGRSPEGMNATGASDLQNYYDMIGQEQESKLRPVLNKILPVLCMSVFGGVPDDLDFEFDPVSEPSDQERSDLARTGTENVVTALNAGLVSKRTALKELKQQSERTGVWTNITNEDIENASNEIEEEGEFGAYGGMGEEEGAPDERYGVPKAEQEEGKGNTLPDREKGLKNENRQKYALGVWDGWEENDHPRKKNGQFTKKGAGEGSPSPEPERGKRNAGKSSEKGEANRGNSLQGTFPKGTIRTDSTSTGSKTFAGADAKTFSGTLTTAKSKVNKKAAWRVTSVSIEDIAEDHPGSICHVTEGGSTVAVEPNGNIWGVCRNPDDSLWGRELVSMAVANGGVILDSYDGNHGFYVKCGFEPVSWCKWDGDYKPPDWSPKITRPEDVIFYRYVGIGKVNPEYISKKGFKSSIPPAGDYMEAQKQQLEKVRGTE